MYQLKKVLPLMMLVMLTACASLSPYNVKVTTGSVVNTDRDSQSLPVEVRVYELSNPTAFESATFRQLWEHDDKILGKTLLDKQVFMADPKTVSTVRLKHDSAAKYIAVMAVFRNLNHNEWRVIRPMSKIGGLSIMVEGNRLTLNK